MAAGIVALALEANPNLTWRDVQHLTVRTARPEGNLKATDWSQNGVGLKFSHRFGFGLMDAGQMTRMAKGIHFVKWSDLKFSKAMNVFLFQTGKQFLSK